MAASEMAQQSQDCVLAHPKFRPRPDRMAIWLALRVVYLRHYRRHIAILRAQGFGAPAETLRQLKLAKRFSTGGCLGWVVSRFLSRRRPFDFHLQRGKILSLWGTSAIASDRVADHARFSPSETLELFVRSLMAMNGLETEAASQADAEHFTRCLREYFADVVATSGDWHASAPHVSAWLEGRRSPAAFSYPEDGAHPRNLSLGLGRQLFELQAELRRAYRADGTEDRFTEGAKRFRRLACEGFRGQLDSLALKTADERVNWRWYAECLLNQKTLNFFLAPLALFAPADAEEENREADLVRAFQWLNACYLHWQVLDDIRDSVKDTHAGLAGAPLLVLVSQGQVAQAIDAPLNRIARKGGHGVEERRAILRVLGESWLLHPRYYRRYGLSPGEVELLEAIHRRVEGGADTPTIRQVQELIRLALANTGEDHQRGLTDLAGRARQRFERLRELQRAGARGELVALLRESGVCRRFLDTVENPDYRRSSEASLEAVTDPKLVEVIGSMRQFVQRAWRFAAIEAGVPQ